VNASYCTPATRDLTAIMLGDSARIQDEEDQLLRILDDEPDSVATPTATSWVRQTISQCVAVPYDRRVSITPRVSLRFADAGHILGSAMTSLTLPGTPREVTLTFTGDLGRRGLPFLRDADPVPAGDVLVCESTYGSRFHQDADSMAEAMARIVNRSAEEGGVILIPAFSLGRTQLVLHYLCRWMADGVLPDLPLFVDSPLAIDISAVYDRYPESFPRPPLGTDGDVHFIRSPQESDGLEERRGPYILVASGGMCDGGRIVKHLRRHIDDPRASLVLVSYQAPDSLGRKLLEKSGTVWFHAHRWNKWIDVAELNGFSGHADQADLLAFLTPLAASVGKVRLVHGEPEASRVLANVLQQHGFEDVGVPARGETVTIGSSPPLESSAQVC
jgi:metallo-beta-lactamase family protein